ncbi:hypothetical protein C8J57DRAFT_151963 [Mycena rebaudengoi]|nr:hypothetical protein C8J57DRAFT_151963 [Mycena rebaudengoi]
MTSESESHIQHDTAPTEPLLLTNAASNESESVPQVQTGGLAVKLDDLGPMVVNSDGTLSRISNWASLTDAEKERTIRVLSARNKIRLASEEQKLKDAGDL